MGKVMHKPVIMGIVNVTPDSFSDGGLYFDTAVAIEHGKRLHREGASILDIGGESTRPGAAPVSVDEEISRVVPVLEGLRETGAILSIDTRHAEVMRAAIKAGSTFINDITALTHDPNAIEVARESGAFVCLMHMQGTPKTMQKAPYYDDVFAEVYAYLKARIDACLSAGIQRNRLYIDPGIGFGKKLEHNLILLRRIGEFRDLGVPVLLGASRKRFIEHIDPAAVNGARLPGSLAACLSACDSGVHHFRVHDVAETVQALNVYRNIRN